VFPTTTKDKTFVPTIQKHPNCSCEAQPKMFRKQQKTQTPQRKKKPVKKQNNAQRPQLLEASQLQPSFCEGD